MVRNKAMLIIRIKFLRIMELLSSTYFFIRSVQQFQNGPPEKNTNREMGKKLVCSKYCKTLSMQGFVYHWFAISM